MRLNIQDALLLGIDFQEKLVPAMHDKEVLIKSSATLLQGLNLLQVPMIITRQYPKGLGDTVAPLREVTPNAQVHDKTTFSCYQDGATRKAIEAFKRKQIIICGTEAHVCVLQTTIDMLADGYQIYYVTDCMGSRRPHDKKFGIKRAALEGAMLTTYEGVLFELMGGAGSPVFKQVSQLIQ